MSARDVHEVLRHRDAPAPDGRGGGWLQSLRPPHVVGMVAQVDLREPGFLIPAGIGVDAADESGDQGELRVHPRLLGRVVDHPHDIEDAGRVKRPEDRAEARDQLGAQIPRQAQDLQGHTTDRIPALDLWIEDPGPSLAHCIALLPDVVGEHDGQLSGRGERPQRIPVGDDAGGLGGRRRHRSSSAG